MSDTIMNSSSVIAPGRTRRSRDKHLCSFPRSPASPFCPSHPAELHPSALRKLPRCRYTSWGRRKPTSVPSTVRSTRFSTAAARPRRQSTPVSTVLTLPLMPIFAPTIGSHAAQIAHIALTSAASPPRPAQSSPKQTCGTPSELPQGTYPRTVLTMACSTDCSRILALLGDNTHPMSAPM